MERTPIYHDYIAEHCNDITVIAADRNTDGQRKTGMINLAQIGPNVTVRTTAPVGDYRISWASASIFAEPAYGETDGKPWSSGTSFTAEITNKQTGRAYNCSVVKSAITGGRAKLRDGVTFPASLAR